MLADLFEFVVKDLIAEILFKPIAAPAPTAGTRWLRRGTWAGAASVAGGIVPAIADPDRFDAPGVALVSAGGCLWLACGIWLTVVDSRRRS